MNWRRVALYFLLYAGVILLDTAFMGGVSIAGVRPDLPLLLLVFMVHYLGAMPGKLIGFAGGLIQDALGLAPLGFHALIGTVIGHFGGLLQGRLYLDALLLPALMGIAATLGKFLVALSASLLFLPEKVDVILSLRLFIELGLHALLAPFIYGLLRLLRLVKDYERHAL
jgi:rod shape-determining protein MreD